MYKKREKILQMTPKLPKSLIIYHTKRSLSIPNVHEIISTFTIQNLPRMVFLVLKSKHLATLIRRTNGAGKKVVNASHLFRSSWQGTFLIAHLSLPDFSWHNLPKQGKIDQITTMQITKFPKIYLISVIHIFQMTLKHSNIFRSKAL
jgi:hypothetical protein